MNKTNILLTTMLMLSAFVFGQKKNKPTPVYDYAILTVDAGRNRYQVYYPDGKSETLTDTASKATENQTVAQETFRCFDYMN